MSDHSTETSQLNNFSVFPEMDDVTSAAGVAYAVVTRPGRLRRVAWALAAAVAAGAGSAPVITIKKNGTTVGETFTISETSIGTGNLLLLEFVSTGLDFAAGDRISLTSDGGPDTGGVVNFECEFAGGTHDAALCDLRARHDALATLNEDAYIGIPVEGQILGFAYILQTATDAQVTLTVEKNGVDTGETVTIPAAAAGAGAVLAPLGNPIDVRANDVLRFDSDGAGTTGVGDIIAILKRGPGRPISEKVVGIRFPDPGSVSTVYTPCARRQRLRAVNGAYKTAHTTPAASLVIEVNGSAPGYTFNAPISVEGDAIDVQDLAPHPAIWGEPGDVISLVSDGGGAAGDANLNLIEGSY